MQIKPKNCMALPHVHEYKSRAVPLYFDAAGRPRIAVSLRTQLEAIYSPDTMEEPRRLRCAVEERLLAAQVNASRLESI